MTLAARIIAWLAAGHLIIGSLFWALLQVPESTVWALALSLVLVLLIVAVSAVVQANAVLWWQIEPVSAPGQNRTARLKGFVRSIPYGRAIAGFILGAIVFFALYWLTSFVTTWWSVHRGEIDAWMMMRTRSPRTAWLTTTVDWLMWIVRYPVALSLSVGLLGAWLHGFRQPARWLRSALHWRPILGIALALLIFIMLPWRYVYWRPESLPANWMELAFVGAKLSVIYVLMNTGWAIVLSAGARQTK
jgi:hypothetical protein